MIADYPEVREGDENAIGDVASGVYERHYEIEPSDRVLDLGAHVGAFTKLCADKGCEVMALEPEPYNFKLLCQAVEGIKKVTCWRLAALDEDGIGILNINPANSGGHSLFYSVDNHPSVVVHSVDIGPWLTSMFFHPTFIKIDTEGAEDAILESLMRCEIRCPMAIEIHSAELYQTCRTILESNNYTFLPKTPHIGVCYANP